MKAGMMTHIGPLYTADWPLNFRIFDNQDGRHFENHENRDISATVWPIFAKSGTMMQNWFLIRPDR